jgi:hypothetical protein
MNILDGDGDNYDDKWECVISHNKSLMSSRCDVRTGCDRNGHQIWRVACNIVNKLRQTSDKGCLPAWWLGEVLKSFLRYGIFHKTTQLY